MQNITKNVLIIGISSKLGQHFKSEFEKIGWQVNQKSTEFDLIIYLRRFPTVYDTYLSTMRDLLLIKQLRFKDLIYVSTTGLMQGERSIIDVRYFGIYNSTKLLQQILIKKFFPKSKTLYVSQLYGVPGFWQELIESVKNNNSKIIINRRAKSYKLSELCYTNINLVWRDINRLKDGDQNFLCSTTLQLNVAEYVRYRNMTKRYLLKHYVREYINRLTFHFYKALALSNYQPLDTTQNKLDDIFEPTGKYHQPSHQNRKSFEVNDFETYSIQWH